MAFPTTAIIDDFDRANGAIDGETCSNGVDEWSSDRIESTAATGLEIISNELGTSGGTGNGWIVADKGADCEMYATVEALPTSGNYIFLAMRIQDVATAGWDGYGLIYIHDTGWQIRRYDNGSSTVLGSTVSGSALSVGDGIGFEIVGDELKGYFKDGAAAWAEVLSRTDATYADPGKIGLEITSTVLLNDLGGGTVVAGGTEDPFPYVIGGYYPTEG